MILKSCVFLLVFLLVGCGTIKDNSIDDIHMPMQSEKEVEFSDLEDASLSPSHDDIFISPVDTDALVETLTFLSQDVRYFDNTHALATLNFLDEKLTGFGYEVDYQHFTVYQNMSDPFSIRYPIDDLSNPIGNSTNLIASYNLSDTTTAPYIVLSAHYDTTSDYASIFDNASGVTAVLEIARLLSKIDLPFGIKVIFFGAEEKGCIGSREYVYQLSEEEASNILAHINIDMLGHPDRKDISLSTSVPIYNSTGERTGYGAPNDLSSLMVEYLDTQTDISYTVGSVGLSDEWYMTNRDIPSITISNKSQNTPIDFADIGDASLQVKYVDLDLMTKNIQWICDFVITLGQ